MHNETARMLFHDVAKGLPVVDYHNHINPLHVAQNRRFNNLARLWVTEDPYKHRAMRINGIAEQGISGHAPDEEKYNNWVRTLSGTMGNPLFHWSCLELKRMFGIDALLTEKNAHEIWTTCNTQLQQPGFGALDILKKWNVAILCTSDDLTGDIQPHRTVNEKRDGVQLLPSLRGDSIVAFEAPIDTRWFGGLSQLQGPLQTLEDYQEAIIQRLDYFQAAGCRLADHSLDAGFAFALPAAAAAAQLYKDFKNGRLLNAEEAVYLKSYLLVFLGKEYCRRGWALQLHIGAQRFTSSRLRRLAGAAGGYAGIGKACDMAALCSLLDALEKEALLPRIILYTLNPADNAAFATLTGSYAQDGMPGKIQFGPAWWYNDHLEGIRQHLVTLGSYGLLGRFIGMTTDSRSLLSFSRHEYFRRILCNQVGTWVADGELPDDAELISRLVQDISYNNSLKYLFNP